MRSSAWSSLAISACSAALVAAGPVHAHIDATPAFLEAGSTGLISLTAHNDRRAAMDGFSIAVPAEVRIDDIGALEGWDGSVDASTATWSGGSLPADEAATFSLFVEAPPDPGTVALRAEQRYPDGEVVAWPVALTVVPGDEAASDLWVYAVVGAGFLLAAAGVALAWRRRDQSPT
jgi:hypothetical protein